MMKITSVSKLFWMCLGISLASSWGDADPALEPAKAAASRLPVIDRVDVGDIRPRHETRDGRHFFWIEAEDFVPAEARQGSWAYRRSWTWSPNALPNSSMKRALIRPEEKNIASASANVTGIIPGRYNLYVRMGAFKPWGQQDVTLNVNGKIFHVTPKTEAAHLNRAFTWVRVNTEAPLEIADSLRLSVTNDVNPENHIIVDGFLLTDDPGFTPPEAFPPHGVFSVLPYDGPGITVEVWHPAVLGTPVYICANSSQQFLLSIRNLCPAPQDNFDVILTLPKGITLKDPSRSRRWAGNSGKWSEPHFIHTAPSLLRSENIEENGQPQNRYTLEYRTAISPFSPYEKVGSLLFIVLTADEHIQPGQYPLAIETRDLSQNWPGFTGKQTLEVLPELDGRQVNGFSWGVDGIYASFLHPDEQKAILKTFSSAGINVWASRTRSADPDLSIRNQEHWQHVRAFPNMRLANWGEFWWPGTPYTDTSKDYVTKHPDAAGVSLPDDRGLSLRGKLICPEYLLHGKDETYIREHAEQTTRTMREHGITELMEDAEYSSPLSYCFDERCKKRFSEVSGIAWDKIKDLSGEEILKRHRHAWIEFRCRQNAEILDKIARAMRAAYPEINFNLFCGYQSWSVRQRYGVEWPLLLKIPDVNGVYVGGGLPGTASQIKQMQEWASQNGKNFISMANATLSFPKGFDELANRNQAYLEARIIHDLLCGSKGIFIWLWATLDGRCMKAFETGTHIAERFGKLIADGQLAHTKAGATDDFQLLTVRGTEGTLISLANPSKSTEDMVLDPEAVMREFPQDAEILDARTGKAVQLADIRQRLDRVFRDGDVELWFIPAQASPAGI